MGDTCNTSISASLSASAHRHTRPAVVWYLVFVWYLVLPSIKVWYLVLPTPLLMNMFSNVTAFKHYNSPNPSWRACAAPSSLHLLSLIGFRMLPNRARSNLIEISASFIHLAYDLLVRSTAIHLGSGFVCGEQKRGNSESATSGGVGGPVLCSISERLVELCMEMLITLYRFDIWLA